MVRAISFLVGLGFVGVLLLALIGTVSGIITDPAAPTVETELGLPLEHKELALASDGPWGKFDRRQVQRGFQVYKEVCSACHSMHLVAFRDLEGLGYSPAQIKKIAADWGNKQSVQDPKSGDRTDRANVASDHFPTVYYAGTGSPPDLSLITKARHGGAPYVYSLLTGYRDQPAELLKKFPDSKTPTGLYYNPYFANLNIAMPPPLASEGQVTYQDGTRPTVDQMAKDVAAFLVWTAEPKMEARHAAGWAALVFLVIFTALTWGAYQNVWRNNEH